MLWLTCDPARWLFRATFGQNPSNVSCRIGAGFILEVPVLLSGLASFPLTLRPPPLRCFRDSFPARCTQPAPSPSLFWSRLQDVNGPNHAVPLRFELPDDCFGLPLHCWSVSTFDDCTGSHVWGFPIPGLLFLPAAGNPCGVGGFGAFVVLSLMRLGSGLALKCLMRIESLAPPSASGSPATRHPWKGHGGKHSLNQCYVHRAQLERRKKNLSHSTSVYYTSKSQL